MRLFWILLICLGVPSAAFAQQDIKCNAVDGLNSIANTRLLIIGEYHGTREIPQFFADVACNWVRSDDRILIGIELHESLSPKLDQLFVKGVGLDNPREMLEPDLFWNDRRDGRHGKANLELLINLATLRRSFPGLRVVALHRDLEFTKRASERVTGFLAANPDYRGLLLVGNAHARLEKMKGQPERPLAARLKDRIPSLISLNIAAMEGGEVILCRQGNCGPIGLPDPIVPLPNQGIQLDDSLKAWDGTYSVGRLSVTLPVR